MNRSLRLVAALGTVALVLLLPPGFPAAAATTPHPAVGPNVVIPDNGTLVNYTSSVDGFALSYEEWLPAGYVSRGAEYPLVIYLHGQQDVTGKWFPGGLPSSLLEYLNASSTGAEGRAAKAIVQNASLTRTILIAVNSRSGAGFYVNSLCGGPQEQDVLDAIAHEATIRHVNLGRLYLVGSSMGSTGVLTLAGHHPGMFRGVASIASGPDMYEGLAWRQYEATQPSGRSWANSSIEGVAALECGVLPSPTANATVLALFTYISVARFDPQAFAHVAVYVTGGGLDMRVPNNASLWNYMQVNNSWVNQTCVVAAADGEPANCTNTFSHLHMVHPGEYLFRYVFESQAPHGLGQLYASDMFAFWMGKVPNGDYVSSYPPTAILPAP